MKKLIPTICLALVGAAAATGSTFAWFSMNKTVEATGMKVKATTSGALVIGKDIALYEGISTNFGDATAHVLSHSTHSADASHTTGLKTIGLNDDVDPVTGVVSEANYIDAVNPDASQGFAYYVDYPLFIASAGQEMTGSKIKMTMTDDMKATVAKNWAYNLSAKTKGMADTLFAFTVDVYSKGVVTSSTAAEKTAEYIGTYHLDDINASLEIAPTDNKIPASMTTGEEAEPQGLGLILRVYLDGDYGKNTVAMNNATGTADGTTVYFTYDSTAQSYTVANVAKGASVTGMFVVGALSKAEGDGRYVHTEKASTDELNLGFKFDAVNA